MARLQPPFLGTQFENLYALLLTGTSEQNLSGIETLYDPDTCPSDALVHLAEQFDVLGYKGWLLAGTETQKRQILKDSVELHQKAGTYSAVERALEAVGFEVVQIIENPTLTFDGTATYNGEESYSGIRWARFIVEFSTPPPADKFELINQLIEVWKPARSHRIIPETLLQYDGTIVGFLK